MLAALHVRRGLDEEERVMILRAGRPQERAGVAEPVGDLEAETTDVEGLGRGDVGNEADDVRERARLGRHVLQDADLIGAALRRRSRAR